MQPHCILTHEPSNAHEVPKKCLPQEGFRSRVNTAWQLQHNIIMQLLTLMPKDATEGMTCIFWLWHMSVVCPPGA